MHILFNEQAVFGKSTQIEKVLLDDSYLIVSLINPWQEHGLKSRSKRDLKFFV